MHKLLVAMGISKKHFHHLKYLKHHVKRGGAAQKMLTDVEMREKGSGMKRHALKFKM